MMALDAFLTTALFPRYDERATLENALAYAQAAEQWGYRGVWITEHHFIPNVGLCPSSLAMAGFLLGQTRRLRVGTAVCTVPLYHPVHLAEQAALLDQLSQGRLDFGIGKGGFPQGLAVFGRTADDLHPVMRESVEVMLRAWTQDHVVADGAFTRFPPVAVHPRPYTRSHPPVYVICQSRPTIELAARHGLPMMLSFTMDTEAKVAQIALYRELAARYGHDPATIEHACTMIGYVGETQREAEDAVQTNLERFFAANHAAEAPAQSGAHHDSGVSHAEAYAAIAGHTRRLLSFNPVGTPQRCAAQIQDVIDRTGVRRVALLCDFAVERARVLETLERFAREVAPVIEPCVPGETPWR